jgi:hypothetical protein
VKLCDVALLRLRGTFSGGDDLTIFEQPEFFNSCRAVVIIASNGRSFTEESTPRILPGNGAGGKVVVERLASLYTERRWTTTS